MIRVADVVQVVAFNYGNDLVVAFHSTAMPDQIDLRREPFVEIGGAEAAPPVARGLLRQWRLVAAPVSRCIDGWLRSHALGLVYVTGHGVGAGLATLQAMFLGCTARTVHVTFGAMRGDSARFRAEFGARVGVSVRVVNGRDDVPTMAIWNGAWPSRLHQVGDVMWFVDGKVETQYVHKARQMMGSGFTHHDHDMDQYREMIELWAQA